MTRSCWTVSFLLSDVLKLMWWVHYRQSETHLNSMCSTDDWFSKGDRTAMKANHLSSFIHTPTHQHRKVLTRRLLLYGAHVKQRKTDLIDSKLRCFSLNSFWMTTRDLFASEKHPEWNITEPFMKSSELLKIKLLL